MKRAEVLKKAELIAMLETFSQTAEQPVLVKTSTTLDIIESAVPSGIRTWPRRALLCIIVFIIALFSTSISAIFLERYKVFL